MTIEEIYNSEDISVRSMNVCNYNGLTDLSAIVKYYQENKKLHILKPKTFDNYNKEQKLKANSYHLDKSGNVVGWHIGGKVKGSKTLDIIEEIKNDFD